MTGLSNNLLLVRSHSLSHIASTPPATRTSHSGCLKILMKTTFLSWSGVLLVTLLKMLNVLTISLIPKLKREVFASALTTDTWTEA